MDFRISMLMDCRVAYAMDFISFVMDSYGLHQNGYGFSRNFLWTLKLIMLLIWTSELMLWTSMDIAGIEINAMENGQIWGLKRYYYELPWIQQIDR